MDEEVYSVVETHSNKLEYFGGRLVSMGKNLKDVRNVLNMKKIVATGLIAGTLFGGTSAFAAGPVQTKKLPNLLFKTMMFMAWQSYKIKALLIQVVNFKLLMMGKTPRTGRIGP